MSYGETQSPNLSIAIPIVIDHDKCDGCLACVRLCPNKALRVRRGKALILPDLCLSCGACVGGCPKSAFHSKVFGVAFIEKSNSYAREN